MELDQYTRHVGLPTLGGQDLRKGGTLVGFNAKRVHPTKQPLFSMRMDLGI